MIKTNIEDIIELLKNRVITANLYNAEWEERFDVFLDHINDSNQYSAKCILLIIIGIYISYKLLIKMTESVLKR